MLSSSTVARNLTRILRVCCGLFAIPTALLSLIFTVYVDYGESVFDFDIGDCFNVVFAAAIFMLAVGAKPVCKLLKRIGVKRCLSILFVYTFTVSLLWVFAADVQPDWDSKALVDCAQTLATAPNDGWWRDGDYVERFPFQIPMILILHGCQLLAGSELVLFFEVINCLATAFTFYFIVKITISWKGNKSLVPYCAILICALFLPLMIYCTFVYGNTLSLAFCAAAFFFQAEGFRKNRLSFHLVAAALASIGIVIKSSMLLVLVALCVVWVVVATADKKPSLLAACVAGFVLNGLIYAGCIAYAETITDTNLHNELPKSTWIVMGTGANEGIRSAPMAGMSDNYIWEIPTEKYSVEEYSKMSSERLAARFRHYLEDPADAIRFFGAKYVYEWCEPTYGSIGASNWTRGLIADNAMSERTLTPIAYSMYYGKLNSVVMPICDGIQFIILIGAVAFVLRTKGKSFLYRCAPLLYASGGALFYLVWEAKSQYIIPFYVCLIPYAAVGIIKLVEQIESMSEKRKQVDQHERKDPTSALSAK